MKNLEKLRIISILVLSIYLVGNIFIIINTIWPQNGYKVPGVSNSEIKLISDPSLDRIREFSINESSRDFNRLENVKILSDYELISLLHFVGFREDGLRSAWAIAKKESRGRPNAHNTNNSTGDNSYGIFQINMIGHLGPDRREKFGIESNNELFNPVKNARAAFYMTARGTNWSSWGIGKNSYNGGASEPEYYEWLSQFPEDIYKKVKSENARSSDD